METVVRLSVALVLGIPFVTAAKSGSGSSNTEKSSLPIIFLLNDMEVVDYLRSGALVVGFLATAFCGKETWMIADTFMLAAFGAVWYFFPTPFLEYQVSGKLDHVHIYLCQAVGAMTIGLAVASYYCRRSSSSGVHTSQFLSRTIGGAVLIQSAAFDYMKADGSTTKFNHNFLTFGMLGSGLWLLGNLVYTIRSNSFGGGRVNLKNRLTQHLLYETLVFTFIGLFHYGFPDISLSLIAYKGFSVDIVHTHLVRLLGVGAFSIGIFSMSAMSFDDNEDKRFCLLRTIVMYAVLYPMLSLYWYQYHILSTKMYIAVLLLSGTVFGNALCGYFEFSLSKVGGKAKRK